LSDFSCTHDYHLHTHLSACCHDEKLTPQFIADFAKAHQYKGVCVTDHVWSRDVAGASSWYAPQDISHIQENLPLPQLADLPFFFGCETEYIGGSKLGLTKENMDAFDFVVIPVNHMHQIGFVRPPEITAVKDIAELVTARLEQLLDLPLPFHKIGIAHLTCSLMHREGDVAEVIECMDTERLKRIFDMLAKKGAGIELNAASSFNGYDENPEAYLRLYRLARDAGCLFYCSSDAHKCVELEGVEKKLPRIVQALGLTRAQQYIIKK
jgi:Histidinol phosphatase and related hydrolases of the PHP family